MTMNIAGLGSDETGKLGTIFDAEPSIVEVVLYGSRAKGTYRSGSDIDLTLKGHDLSTNWLMELAGKIDDLLLPYEVDLSIYEHIENQDLIDHIRRVGKVVFSNE